FDDFHFVTMRDASRQLHVIVKPDCLRNQSIALPVSNRRTKKLRIRILRKRAAISIDMTNLSVRLDDDGYLTGRHQEFHRIGLTHDSRHTWRQTISSTVVFRLWRTSRSGSHRFILCVKDGPPPRSPAAAPPPPAPRCGAVPLLPAG